jgi:hypothetical protein
METCEHIFVNTEPDERYDSNFEIAVLAQLSQLALWNGDFWGGRGRIVSRNKGAWWQILCSVDQVSFG